MRAKIQGQVVVQTFVRDDGTVEKARIILGLDPDLDEQALIAADNGVSRPAFFEAAPCRSRAC